MMTAKTTRVAPGWAISLGLLKAPPSLKTKQCNGQQLCICGKSQTAGLDRAVMDGCTGGGGWRHTSGEREWVEETVAC